MKQSSTCALLPVKSCCYSSTKLMQHWVSVFCPVLKIFGWCLVLLFPVLNIKLTCEIVLPDLFMWLYIYVTEVYFLPLAFLKMAHVQCTFRILEPKSFSSQAKLDIQDQRVCVWPNEVDLLHKCVSFQISHVKWDDNSKAQAQSHRILCAVFCMYGEEANHEIKSACCIWVHIRSISVEIGDLSDYGHCLASDVSLQPVWAIQHFNIN